MFDNEMPARLAAFLAEVESASDVVVHALDAIPGGYSRLMARAEVEWSADGRVRREVLVLRGDPPPDATAVQTDRDEEWDVLSALTGRVPMPAARWYDPEGRLLGTKTIVLDFVPGPSLLAHLATGAELAPVADRLCDAAAAVHGVDLGLLPERLEQPTGWDAYLDDLVGRWRAAERAHVESDPFMRYVGAWLDAHRPPPAPLTLVHGDFQSANVIVGADGALHVVDWEFAHVGDPREDLGWFMAVALAAPPDPISHDLERFCARYRDRTGMSEEVVSPATLAYFVVLGAIRIFENLQAQIAAYARDETTSITVPYNVNAAAFAHGVWLGSLTGLEAATSLGSSR